MKLSAATALMVLVSSQAVEHAPVVERGVAGLQAVQFTARNAAEVPISCSISIAHWYSLALGTAPSKGLVTATFWFDRSRGAVFKMTDDDVRLPVEVLWCGLEGKSWATRFEVSLPRHAGVAAAPMNLTCATQSGRLHCR